MTTEQFDNTFQSVAQRLPSEVVTALTDFWHSTPTTVPGEGDELLAPQLRLLIGWPKESDEARMFLYANPHPGCLLFNGEFVAEAPIEVVESAIAEALAASYLKITDPTRFPWAREATDKDVSCLTAGWGFNPDEIPLYQAARAAHPELATAYYYAFRYVKYKRLPHASADVDPIVAVLKMKGCGHLEAALRSNACNKIRIFDFPTKAITEIPVSELAPGYVLAGVEGVDGPVYVNIQQVSPGEQPKHGSLSKEFKRAIRHCMKLVGDTDTRTFEEHVHAFLLDSNPTKELMVFFRSAIAFRNYAAKHAVPYEQRRRLWQWIVHCSMTEPSTVLETWDWQPGERGCLEPVAHFYFTFDYEKEFKKMFDPKKVFALPLHSATENTPRRR